MTQRIKTNRYAIPYKELPYGFTYGAADVERAGSDTADGSVRITIRTPATRGTPLEIRVTRTGLIRIFRHGEWSRRKKGEAELKRRMGKRQNIRAHKR